MSSLSHHGIKGQKWGVRRFQNPDGTRTSAGKKQEKLRRLKKTTSEDFISIRKTLSDNDLQMLNYDDESIKYMRENGSLDRDPITDITAHRVIQKDRNGTPVAYVEGTGFTAESLLSGKAAARVISIDLATRAGDEYRGKGHAVAAGKKMVEWFDRYGYKDYEYMEWAAKEENIASQKTAEKLGFKKLDVHDEGWTLYAYEHKAKHTSIGGTIYIEGNTLILGDSSYLEHHGIRGQRWGVRRFQNKDGTRTALGKHRDFERTASKVVDDLSNSPQPFIRRPLNKDKIRQRGLITQAEADQCAGLAAGVFKQASKVEPQITGDVIDVVSSTSAKMYGLNNRLKQPTSIAAKIGSDAKSDGITFEQAANGLKDVIRYTAVSDSRDYVDTYNAIKQQLEEKGYTEVKCKNYFQKYQNGEVMHKAVQSTFRSPDGVDFEFQFQTPESQAAKELKVPIYNERRKAGNTPERNAELEQKMRNLAEQVPDPEGVFGIKSHSGVTNSNKVKHTSIGGTMYIEGNALILGDSSYLEHHGIRGQRWGVRRFQNRDGSLTNAGRKRLGYATKGAVQTVSKAFKAGVKAGGNAVKAVKAHHEKKEAEKLEKKKEKASHSRLGVLANKDLFTDDELRALNQRFKVEDELKMASIQKGVEIAKAVGTIASNAATAAKAYEDITGQSLSPIKRQAAELKKQQDAEDRARKIASEDAEEARKAAQEERNIKKFDQELRKATADADKEEFLAKKTKAQADQEILKALKGARDFDKPDDDPPKSPSGSDDGSSWVQKATAGGKNPFDKMLYDNDPEYKAAKDAHDEKVARKERMEYLDKHIAEREREKQAEKEAKDQALRDMINQSNARTGRGQSNPAPTQTPPEPEYQSNLLKQLKPVYFGPDLREASERERGRAEAEKHNKEWEQQFESKEAADKWLRDRVAETQARNKAAKDNAGNSNGSKSATQDSDALFSQKGSLPIDKDRYRNRKAAEKAKKVKEDVAEDRAKKQDEKAVDQTINDVIAAQRRNNETIRNMDPHAYDRSVAKEYVKDKAKETINKIPETLGNLNPINRAARKIANKVEQEGYENTRKAMKQQYEDMAKSQGRDEANYVMYNTRLAGLQGQGYSEKQARQIADSDPTFSSKRNRRVEYSGKVAELETARRNTSKKLDEAERELSNKYYKTINSNGDKYYNSPEREALDRDYERARANIQKLREENQQLFDKGIKDAQKILEHSFSIQNGVLFIDSSDGLAHHGVKGQRWGVRRFQNADGSLTPKGRKHYEKKIEKLKLKQSDMEEEMYHVENGTLFINAGEPYLEHHGVLGMKWGKHLRAGKGPADAPASSGGGGGGAPEEDEETKKKIEEAAKKAGMSVAEFRTKMASKIGSAAAKAKKEIGYAYGSEYKKDFERAARLHENNSKSMHAQAKAAWEGYDESRTAAQRDNWKRYAEYDRQAKASGNMFVKRERSKQAYDNSLASKVDSVKRKARLTKDKAKSKISDTVDAAAKKTRDDVKSNIRSKTGIGVKKDINRNARLAEGEKRRAHELTKQVYSAKNKDDWARAYSESNKESFKAWNNEHKANKDAKSYPKSIAGRVDSAKRKTRLTKDRLKSALGKSKQRKQLSTEGPKAKKQISNARDSVEKASRSNENAYKHAKAVYRQTGSDSDAYKQAIKRSGTTLQRYIDSKKLLAKKKRAKHSDDTNAVYTEGTKLVINSKWG